MISHAGLASSPRRPSSPSSWLNWYSQSSMTSCFSPDVVVSLQSGALRDAFQAPSRSATVAVPLRLACVIATAMRERSRSYRSPWRCESISCRFDESRWNWRKGSFAQGRAGRPGASGAARHVLPGSTTLRSARPGRSGAPGWRISRSHRYRGTEGQQPAGDHRARAPPSPGTRSFCRPAQHHSLAMYGNAAPLPHR